MRLAKHKNRSYRSACNRIYISNTYLANGCLVKWYIMLYYAVLVLCCYGLIRCSAWYVASCLLLTLACSSSNYFYSLASSTILLKGVSGWAASNTCFTISKKVASWMKFVFFHMTVPKRWLAGHVCYVFVMD